MKLVLGVLDDDEAWVWGMWSPSSGTGRGDARSSPLTSHRLAVSHPTTAGKPCCPHTYPTTDTCYHDTFICMCSFIACACDPCVCGVGGGGWGWK
jgi:hypothetical protein